MIFLTSSLGIRLRLYIYIVITSKPADISTKIPFVSKILEDMLSSGPVRFIGTCCDETYSDRREKDRRPSLIKGRRRRKLTFNRNLLLGKHLVVPLVFLAILPSVVALALELQFPFLLLQVVPLVPRARGALMARGALSRAGVGLVPLRLGLEIRGLILLNKNR